MEWLKVTNGYGMGLGDNYWMFLLKSTFCAFQAKLIRGQLWGTRLNNFTGSIYPSAPPARKFTLMAKRHDMLVMLGPRLSSADAVFTSQFQSSGTRFQHMCVQPPSVPSLLAWFLSEYVSIENSKLNETELKYMAWWHVIKRLHSVYYVWGVSLSSRHRTSVSHIQLSWEPSCFNWRRTHACMHDCVARACSSNMTYFWAFTDIVWSKHRKPLTNIMLALFYISSPRRLLYHLLAVKSRQRQGPASLCGASVSCTSRSPS